jgi:hypothetical protein
MGGGNDTIHGNGGTDTLRVIQGSDHADAATAVSFDGASLSINGAELVTTGVENFDITLGAGNDVVDASGATVTGALTVNLGGGDNIYVAALGTGHTITAGSGTNDRIDFSAYTAGVTVDLANNKANGAGFVHTITGFEQVVGSSGNDRLYGRNLASDWFVATEGNDLIDGGTGVDTYDASGITQNLNIDLRGTSGVASFGIYRQDLYGIENVIGGSGDDVFRGSNAANHFDGGAGNDTIVVAGNRGDYKVLFNAITGIGTISRVDGTGSADTFTNIESLVFDDTAISPTASNARVDFGGDGGADLLLQSSSGWYSYRSDPNYTSVHDIGFNAGKTLIGIADFDGDGRDDMLFVNPTSDWYSYFSGGDRSATVEIGSNAGKSVVGIGDFDGDGRADILFKNDASGWYSYYSGGSKAATVDVGSNNGRELVGVADFDGDGRDDMLFVNPTNGYYSYFGGGDRSELVDIGAQAGKTALALADLNGDGAADILLRSSSGWYSFVDGSTHILQDIGFQNGKTLIGVGDFDGDGADDLLFLNPSSGWLSYLTSDGLVDIGSAPAYSVRGIDDYNGDGRDDLLLQHNSTGEGVIALGGSLSNTQTVGPLATQDVISDHLGLLTDDILIG